MAGCTLPFVFFRLTGSEPYPAIIFPGGAGLILINDGDVDFVTLKLFGYDEHDRVVELDTDSYLNPLPSSYVNALVESSFAQDQVASFDLHFKVIGLTIRDIAHHTASEEERLEAREWLSDKLADLGLDDSRLGARYYRIALDHNTGDVLSRTIVDEAVVNLDR